MKRKSNFGRNNKSNDELKKYIAIGVAIFIIFLMFWKAGLNQESVENKIDIPTPEIYSGK